jgi:SNF2 family DNA or RNA helicase
MIFGAEGGRKRMLALTALLRLRQACCDLRLLNLPEMEDKNGSVKMGELESLLQEAVEGGHRVLVFSQFVKMLQGMVPMLMENGFEFCYLDGQTKNRGEVVSRFQESPGIPVFLISLKAGGVGLNLTGADTVIHVDPWWNPAVEAQATDRAHRIGQDRVVTSYKLITRNTVEEKILALQERKKELIASTLDAGLPTGGSSLSEGEIFELFA